MHNYDRRDTDKLAPGQESDAYCIECKSYHRIKKVSLQDAGYKVGEIITVKEYK